MAKVILECNEPSLNLEKKVLILEEGIGARLGRCHENEVVSNVNGLIPENIHLVSYEHALVTYVNGEFYLEDLSSNGTYINGNRLKRRERHLLISGDIIQLGGDNHFSPCSDQHDAVLPLFFVKVFTPLDNTFNFLKFMEDTYNTPFQLYEKYPSFCYSLELLHECTRQRLKVLQVLDDLGISFSLKGSITHFLNQLTKEPQMVKLITGTSQSYEEEYNLLKMDHVSHYIVGLSCCQNFVLKKWFIDQEVKLLRIRWHFLSDLEKHKVISRYHYDNYKVNKEDKLKLLEESGSFIEIDSEYYKVSAFEVSELFKQRNVFIKNGYCFVSKDNLIYAFGNDFIKIIKRNLKLMKKNLHHIWQDERILAVISYIKKEVNFERFLFDNRKSSTVILTELDKLAHESFPLCMKDLHNKLKKHNHLKNGGRFQYGLFLKGIGLSLQDSLTFWRYYLTRRMPLGEFIKNYQYHILHSYGAAGKKADYPPHSCKKILEAIPSYGEYHGCPFKILGKENLAYILKENSNIGNEGISNIIEISKGGSPSLACKTYFELTQDFNFNGPLYHPVQYFKESQKIRKDRNEENSNFLDGQKAAVGCSCSKKFDW